MSGISKIFSGGGGSNTSVTVQQTATQKQDIFFEPTIDIDISTSSIAQVFNDFFTYLSEAFTKYEQTQETQHKQTLGLQAALTSYELQQDALGYGKLMELQTVTQQLEAQKQVIDVAKLNQTQQLIKYIPVIGVIIVVIIFRKQIIKVFKNAKHSL